MEIKTKYSIGDVVEFKHTAVNTSSAGASSSISRLVAMIIGIRINEDQTVNYFTNYPYIGPITEKSILAKYVKEEAGNE